MSGVLLAGLTGCGGEPLAQPTVRDFLLAWQNGEFGKAAALTTGEPRDVTAALGHVGQQLDAVAFRFGLGPLRQRGDQAQATFRAEVDLGENGQLWNYVGRLDLRRAAGRWRILWSPSVIHPQLRPGHRLAVVTTVPKRAPVLAADSRPLVVESPVVEVGVVPTNVDNPEQLAAALAKQSGFAADRLVGRIRSAPPHSFLPLVVFTRDRFVKAQAKLTAIPGLSLRHGRLPLHPAAAGGIVGEAEALTEEAVQRLGVAYLPGETLGRSGLQRAYQRSLAGSATTRVVVIGPAGRQTAVLAEWRGNSPAPVRTTIVPRVQAVGDRAVRTVGLPAALVALQPSTGRVLAVSAAGMPHGEALNGRFPPGSAFMVVSTEALLNSGLRIDEPIPCPPVRNVGGKVFRNRQVNRLPPAPPFRVSFAHACVTAFAGLARRLGADGLLRSASRFGIGGRWSLPVPVFTGEVPRPKDEAREALEVIGNGETRMSPLGMGLIAAAVASGTWRPPQLVTAPPGSATAVPVPLDPTSAATLRELMRLAVLEGTARPAGVGGPRLYGVSGAAPFTDDGKSRVASWFIGWQGDVAVAVLVKTVGQEPAALTAGQFFARLNNPSSGAPAGGSARKIGQ